MSIFRRAETILVLGMVLVRMLIAVGFSAVGTLEGPDEPGHFAYVRVIVTISPLVNPYLITDPLGQYHQAPLYYWLAAPIAASVGVGTDQDLRDFLRFNDLGDTRLPIVGKDNQNYWLHTASDRFPYTGNPIARAVHAVRLLSILLGGLTVLAAYAAFRQIWPGSAPGEAGRLADGRSLRLLGTGLIAFWPQLIFLSSVINNDNLLFLLATLAIVIVLRQLRSGWTQRESILLGILLGLCALTKVNGLLMAFPVGAAVLIDLWPSRSAWRARLRLPLLTALVTITVGGWWYARNFILYSDPFNFHAMYVSWGGVTIPGSANGVALGYAIRSLPGVYDTWWARFGYTGMLEVGSGIGGFFNALTLLALLGLLILLVRSWITHRPLFPTPLQRSQTIIFITWLGALFVGLVYYAGREIQGNQARYLFPALVAIGAGLAIGWRVWLRGRALPLAAGLLTIVLCAISLISLTAYYWPAFRPTPIPAVIDHPTAINFGTPPLAELIGASVPPRVLPGERIQITLDWRALGTVDHDVILYLHSVGNQIIFRNSYPGGGTLLSTDWQPGDRWQETYTVTIPVNAPSQSTLTVVAGLADRATNAPLIATNADSGDGKAILPIIGHLAINAPPAPLPAADVRLGDTIGVADPIVTRQPDGVQLCLDWLSYADQTSNPHVFVHLLDPAGTLIGQYDGVPLAGRYPVIGWGADELIHDCMTVPVTNPPNGTQIAFGLYDPVTGQRLPVMKAAGQYHQNDEIILPLNGDF